MSIVTWETVGIPCPAADKVLRAEGDKYIEVAGGRPGEPITLTEPLRVTLDPASLGED